MGKFVRLLIMFGPMLYKGVTKFMASRKQQDQDPPSAPQNEDDFVDEQ